MNLILACVIFFLTAFTSQSLMILLFRRDKFMWFTPLVMFVVPYYIISHSSIYPPADPMERIYAMAGMYLILAAADILGWIAGLGFRRLIEEDINEFSSSDEDEDSDDRN